MVKQADQHKTTALQADPQVPYFSWSCVIFHPLITVLSGSVAAHVEQPSSSACHNMQIAVSDALSSFHGSKAALQAIDDHLVLLSHCCSLKCTAGSMLPSQRE